jgi:kynurenine 3-monooxygenase
MHNHKKITILGAGLVGSLAAILFQKRGFEVSIFERRGDMRLLKLSAGKSINLAMSVRGWAALEMAGLRKEIEAIAIPMYGRKIYTLDGNAPFQSYGKNNEAIYSVSRGDLNKKLMSLAEEVGVQIKFNHRATDIQIDTNEITFDVENGQQIKYNDHSIIIAADGAFSALRNAYTKKDRFNYSQFYIEHGYKELFIPAGENNTFLIDKNALHIWPRKNYMVIALPNFDGSFTCTLFFPFEGSPSFDSLKTQEDVSTFFKEQFPNAYALMPTLLEDYFSNPTSSLVTVKCFPWVHENKSILIGDAAHAIVPFYGQGMNAGFEDVRILMELYDKNPQQDWGELFQQYQTARKVNGDAVAELALQNFIEMRDLVADPIFLERKKIEKQLGLLYPAKFTSVYEMVSFSHHPYDVAIRCQQAQDKLLTLIMQEGNFDSNIETIDFKNRLADWLENYQKEIQTIIT